MTTKSFAELTAELSEVLRSTVNESIKRQAQALLVETAMRLDERRQASIKGGLAKTPKKKVSSRKNGSKGGRKPTFDEAESKVIREELKTMSMEQLAIGYGVPVSTIKSTLKRYGLDK